MLHQSLLQTTTTTTTSRDAFRFACVLERAFDSGPRGARPGLSRVPHGSPMVYHGVGKSERRKMESRDLHERSDSQFHINIPENNCKIGLNGSYLYFSLLCAFTTMMKPRVWAIAASVTAQQRLSRVAPRRSPLFLVAHRHHSHARTDTSPHKTRIELVSHLKIQTSRLVSVQTRPGKSMRELSTRTRLASQRVPLAIQPG